MHKLPVICWYEVDMFNINMRVVKQATSAVQLAL